MKNSGKRGAQIKFESTVSFRTGLFCYIVSLERGSKISAGERWTVTEIDLSEMNSGHAVNGSKGSVAEIHFLKGGDVVLCDGKGGESTIQDIVDVSSLKVRACEGNSKEENFIFTRPSVVLDWIVSRTSGKDTVGGGIKTASDLYLVEDWIVLCQDGVPCHIPYRIKGMI